MKQSLMKLALAIVAIGMIAGTGMAQPYPSDLFADFSDPSYSSTFNGNPLPIGSIIEAYDPDGVLVGVDTTTVLGTFGFMPVYGDDVNTTGLDEGAEDGDVIAFFVNGKAATVTSGDDTWAYHAQRHVVLEASSTVALTAVTLPMTPDVIAPDHTRQFEVVVRNDGDARDYYGVTLSLEFPDDPGSNFEWLVFEPDSVVYADPGEEVSVFFSVYAPTFNQYTFNTVTYTVYSNLDPSVTVSSDLVLERTITDVGDDIDQLLPGQFALQQNYPNPFNPSTNVAFELTVSTRVQFEVYDVIGRQIEQRDLGYLTAGTHELTFDGGDLASGVYFYRLVTEAGAQTRKMVLLK